jgi:hypothetical protein
VSLFDLSAEVDAFATHTLTVSRASAGSYVAGRFMPSASNVTTLLASVQPATGKELQLLPEGARERASVAIYTAGDLRNGDGVMHEGESYRVLALDPWRAAGAYVKAIAVREG